MRSRYDAPIPGVEEVQSARTQRRHEHARQRRAAMAEDRVAWFPRNGYSVCWRFDLGAGMVYRVLLEEDTRPIRVPEGKEPGDFVKEVRRSRKNEKMAEKLGKTLPQADFSVSRPRL